MSLRSPLGAALGHGSARSGPAHGWNQRLSALALVPLGLWFLCALLALPDLGHATVVAWIATPTTAVLLLLFALLSLWHSLLGVATIVEDYVHGPVVKTASLLALQAAHGVAALCVIVAVIAILGGSAR
ncbi:MAG: succinate dehydrogenase, hydrophobic membrane anchor protein [Gammaproteobacteria bacterium]|nr:succinate dehydrogenase, hydrophobic membrane anchor protein [Gammaproteobacteria bacterium]